MADIKQLESLSDLKQDLANTILRVNQTKEPVFVAVPGQPGVAIIDAPVLASGRLELRWYLREQTLSWLRHRYGSVQRFPDEEIAAPSPTSST